ncbi:MAG TPA: translational GTPase TypA [Deltaproteobacteria bacterium]|nr:MAG: GTP-binding protein TypA [Deltaproteobacteria bacterium GWA2_45_12]HBF13355.1 translational GTPase TypA [Deltaproteobacteria bacterium]
MKQINDKIRNIAIIAHVDHGKTTLVDHLFRQGGLYRDNQAVSDRVMDNLDLERERGITIAAKNCSVSYNGIKINIVDTPGHADFGGEVERALMMVDGVILLVDSAEGPLPQTRFVLQKALKLKLKTMVVVNKIDRKDSRPKEVLDEIYQLYIDLGATDEQIDFPFFYAIGRDGIAKKALDGTETDLKVLFEAIINKLPPPSYDDTEPFQMLVCNLGYSDYLGRLAIGKVFHGKAKKNDALLCVDANNKIKPLKVSKLQLYQGIQFQEVDRVEAGDIVILSGIDEVKIGDTICTVEAPKALPRILVDEPTVAMRFMPNTSPFSGKEGKYVQSARIWDRLKKEILYNVAIQIEMDANGETMIVKGRGELQLAVIIETMRREGFELCVGKPQILFKEINGQKCEPIENLVIDCGDSFTGIVIEKLALRKGVMKNMQPFGEGRVRLEFSIPSRGLIGYRGEFLTDTKGTGLMNAYLEGYEPHRGDIVHRISGSLISDRMGEAIPYGLFHLEDRGRFFITPGTAVYEGMIVGEHNRDNDLEINVTRTKKLTNMRAAGKDENVILTPVLPPTLEQAIEFIKDDEWVEVTPLNVRLRKAILNSSERKIASKKIDSL